MYFEVIYLCPDRELNLDRRFSHRLSREAGSRRSRTAGDIREQLGYPLN